ncbi:MAG: HNH endonuclease [Actinomycetota bacterium]
MDVGLVDQAIELLEKANAELEPELLDSASARAAIAAYARAEKLATFGVAALFRKVADSAKIAQITGSSIGKAKAVVQTGAVMATSSELTSAMQTGSISFDQAAEVAAAEESAPGCASELVAVAQSETFHSFKHQARRTKLEAEQHRGLAERQHAARSARRYSDELGMVHIHMAFEPHIGAPILARAETEAARRARAAKATGEQEPFERYLADAYASLLSSGGSGTTKSRRPEVVVLVSHEVVKRGWSDVMPGEVCKNQICSPPLRSPRPPKTVHVARAPDVAREIADDAFLTGVVYDGTDLRHMRRWSRTIPVEVKLALELGKPPAFDGIACVDCGNRFRNEFDHVHPRAAGGPISTKNIDPRCHPCHLIKTAADRRAGLLTPPEP